MSVAELERAIESKKRIEKQRAQERASYDYILADLIGRSVARVYSSANNMPQINEVYPTIFDTEEIEAQQSARRDELSALRFRQFALSHNTKLKGGGNKS